MKDTSSEAPTSTHDDIRWRKSTHSQDGACVEIAEQSNGTIAVRNSNHPGAGTIAFTRAELAAWIAGCTAGEYDDLIA
jgi:hypothetical protein